MLPPRRTVLIVFALLLGLIALLALEMLLIGSSGA